MDLDAMVAEHQATYRALCDTSALPVDTAAWVAETRRLRDENERLRALLAECRGFLADVCDSPLPEQAAELRAKVCRAVPPPSLADLAGSCADAVQ